MDPEEDEFDRRLDELEDFELRIPDEVESARWKIIQRSLAVPSATMALLNVRRSTVA